MSSVSLLRLLAVRALNLVLTLSLFALSGAVLGIGAAGAEPRFEDYPAPAYSGRVRTPDLSSHPDANTYRTRLRNAAKGGVNFSGDHVLVTWGCGGQCLTGAVINARSGAVQFLPGTICCWLDAGEEINPVDFELHSNLLILTGLLDEEEPLARHYFDFSNRKFRLIETRPLTSNSSSGGGHSVDPTCPSGYVLTRGRCVREQVTASSPPTSSNAFDIRDGYDLPGGDYDRLPGKVHYDDCLNACKRDSRCFAFTYNSRARACFLKGERQNWTRFRGAISGVRVTRRAGGVGCESRCDRNYDRCLERLDRNPNAGSTNNNVCSDPLDNCRASCAVNRGECYTHEDGSRICP